MTQDDHSFSMPIKSDRFFDEKNSFLKPISKRATQWHILAILIVLILHVILLCLILCELVRINDRAIRLIIETNSAVQKK